MIKYGIIFFACVYLVQSALASCPCTREYNPQCGSNGVTYSNPCAFRCAKRLDNKLTSTPGQCRRRAIRQLIPSCVCPRLYAPVCGTDGKTYSNECELTCAKKGNPSLRVQSSGPCRKDDNQRNANCLCTLEYNPVCGTDFVTYPNECSLRCAKSENPGLEVSYNGECVDPRCTTCPAIADHPLCGSDGKTYQNIMCDFACEKLKNPTLTKLYDGECRKPSGCACPYLYNPVCGSDWETYPNECVFKCEQKKRPELTIIYESQCPAMG